MGYVLRHGPVFDLSYDAAEIEAAPLAPEYYVTRAEVDDRAAYLTSKGVPYSIESVNHAVYMARHTPKVSNVARSDPGWLINREPAGRWVNPTQVALADEYGLNVDNLSQQLGAEFIE
jgi:hypothetical protein